MAARPEAFRIAADVIRLGGLCKDQYFYNGQCCTIGALNTALSRIAGYAPELGCWYNRTSISDTECSAEFSLLERLVQELEPGMSVSSWNDSEGTTAADVIALFERAAERCG